MNKKILIIFFIALLLYFLPYFVKGKDSYIPQFDNLDQLSHLGIFDGSFNGHFFPSTEVEENYMPGLEPIFRVSILSVPKLYWKLGILWGFVLNEVVIRIVAIFGLYFLINILGGIRFPKYLSAFISIAFAYLPFWSQGGLSVAGLPLLTYAIYNIHQNQRKPIYYFFIIVFPFYSSFFLSGIFILLILIGIIIYQLLKKQNVNSLLVSFFILLILYIAINYSFFIVKFIDKIPTNRSEITTYAQSFREVFLNYFLNFLVESRIHAPSFHQFLMLPIIMISLLFFNKANKFARLSITLLLFQIFIAILYGTYHFKPLSDVYNRLQIGFNYTRFYFISAAVWYVLWALCLSQIYFTFRRKKNIVIIISIIIFVQIGIIFMNSSAKIWTEKPSFREVIAYEQFGRIDEKLSQKNHNYDKNKIRIGCIGFQPTIANINGFKTLGAYQPFYSLSFKQKFTPIIENELKNNKVLYDYYHHWGLQTYLFDDDIGLNLNDQNWIKQNCPSIICDLDIDLLKKMGVNFLFSVANIKNSSQIGIKLVFEEQSAENYYNMFVYEL
ncbi:MAG: DUF6044 family protein [Candidatus Cloacimonetes bacterium]|nr:DUF6044 family protein [Candidatus Cloacimonadota bacterium]